jgi:RNA polymerase sigma-70 factor (ECF subfamily)
VSTAGPAPNFDELLAHAAWVRQLARQLVRDEARADDVVQETWTAALQHPPRTASNLRAWLAQVARNAARDLRRSETQRQRREEVAARAEALPSTAELAERASLQRELVGRVLALDEPHKAVLLLRYFEELSHEETAARLGVPVATVRTRHARALEQLREKLTREHGDRATWCSALATLARSPRGKAALVTGGVIVGLKLKLAAAAVLVTVLAVFSWRAFTRDEARMHESQVSASAELAPPAENERITAEDPFTRTAASAAPMEAAAPVAEPALVPYPLQGRIVDTFGRPVPHVRLLRMDSWVPSRPTPESYEQALRAGENVSRAQLAQLDTTLPAIPIAADGTFTFPGYLGVGGQPFAAGDHPLTIWQPGWALVGRGWRATSSGSEFVVVVSPSVALRGVCVDETAAPVAGASLSYATTVAMLTTLPDLLASTQGARNGSGKTNSRGEFELAGVPSFAPALLRASAAGFRLLETQLELSGERSDVRLVLQRAPAAPPDIRVSGRVVDAEGRGVVGAQVLFAHSSMAPTHAEGRFEFSLSDSELMALERIETSNRTGLLAFAAGFLPGSVPDFVERARVPHGLEDLVVTLGPPARSIAGRVVAEDGTPRAGFEVRLLDPTWIDPGGSDTIEMLSLDTRVRVQSLTDATGQFQITGLLERTYRLRAVRLETPRAVFDFGPIAAGASDVELRMPPSTNIPSVRGRLVSRHGRAIAGARLLIQLWAGPEREPRERNLARAMTVGASDGDGRFEIADVPTALALVAVESSFGGLDAIDIAGFAPGSERTLVVPCRVRFRVECSPALGVTRFQVLDAAGRARDVLQLRPDGGAIFPPRESVHAGRSAVCQVSDDAATLVLYAGDAEVKRVPLTLYHDELNVVRP